MSAEPARLPFQRPTNEPAAPPQIALPGPLLLTPAEAAKALAISPRTLWDLTNRGEIRAIRIGRAVRYDPRDLLAWIDRQKT